MFVWISSREQAGIDLKPGTDLKKKRMTRLCHAGFGVLFANGLERTVTRLTLKEGVYVDHG